MLKRIVYPKIKVSTWQNVHVIPNLYEILFYLLCTIDSLPSKLFECVFVFLFLFIAYIFIFFLFISFWIQVFPPSLPYGFISFQNSAEFVYQKCFVYCSLLIYGETHIHQKLKPSDNSPYFYFQPNFWGKFTPMYGLLSLMKV